MTETLLIPITEADLRKLIKDCISDGIQGLKSKTENSVQKIPYIPIKTIFDLKICSKPTFYKKLREGSFRLYKFGNKSFVKSDDFFNAFHEVSFNKK